MVVAPLQGAALFALALPVFVHGVLSVLLVWGPGLLVGMAFRTVPPVEANRRLTGVWRRLIGRWHGVAIPTPYRALPPRPVAEPDGTYRYENRLFTSDRVPWMFQRIYAYAEDPATGRDVGWMLLYPFLAAGPAAAPGALIVAGIAGPLWFGTPLWTAALVVVGILAGPALVRLSLAWSRSRLAPARPAVAARKLARLRWLEHHGTQLRRLATVTALGLVGVPLLALSLVALVAGTGLGMVFLLPLALTHFRWLAHLRRDLVRDWSGVPVDEPYRTVAPPERLADGSYRVGRRLFRSERIARFRARSGVALGDPASWRDLLWLTLDPAVGGVIGAVPVLLVWYGGWALFVKGMLAVGFGGPHGEWYGAVNGNVAAAMPAGIGLVALGLWMAPGALRLHSRWTALLLRPTPAARLARRVERLTETRTDAVDAQAAEVRRIERDLHDGAQARLVSVGLTLGAIERLMDTDPTAARRLIAQAQDTSATALAELRDLVRGIHPPVLSERGLGDAIRALALNAGMRVDVRVDLPDRCAAPVETAMYFAVSEVLTNAIRHAGASHVTVDLRHHEDILTATVTDDGRGGADPAAGTGLRGIDRRLGTVDGTLTVLSPAGGPTVVTMEVPCVSSSPKTSTSSGTG
jgi:signal transduction histidine kinase